MYTKKVVPNATLADTPSAKLQLAVAIYTKRGDKGETGLYSSTSSEKRVSKDSLRIQAIGVVDEANSFLGIISSGSPPYLAKEIKSIQEDLFTLGAILAGAKLRFSRSKTKILEKKIDILEGSLPVLKNFAIPSGGWKGTRLQFARTLVRRAERQIVALSNVETVKVEVMTYINRLSDYLFELARKVNYDEGYKEKIWRGRGK